MVEKPHDDQVKEENLNKDTNKALPEAPKITPEQFKAAQEAHAKKGKGAFPAGMVPPNIQGGAGESPEKEEYQGPRWSYKASDIRRGSQDPLLGCLVNITQIFSIPHSGESLVSGLPLEEEGLTPALFVRAAQRANFSARIVRREFSDIPPLVLPAVLILKGKKACILTKIERDKCEVILPESGEGKEILSVEALEEQYDNHAIFIRPKFHFTRQQQDKRSNFTGSWFWGTLSLFSKSYIQVILAAIMINTLAVITPLYTMNVYDRVVPNDAIETLIALSIGMIIAISFDFILKTLRGYFVDNAGKRADVLLSGRIFEHVLNIKMESCPGSAGGFANRIRDYESLREFFTSATLIALVDVPFLGIFIFVIWLIAGPVSYVLLVAVPVVIIMGLIFQFPLRKAVNKSIQESAQKQGVIVETIGGLETIKSLGAEGKMQNEWEKFVGQSAQTGQKARMISQLGINFSGSIQQLVTVAVVFVGVGLIKEQEITMGALIACSILSGRTMAPLGQIAGLLSRLHQSLESFQSLNEIMAYPVEREPDKKYLSRHLTHGEIEFRDVSFTYPQSNLHALKEVSFRIKSGERVAFLGPIGSGKSTVSKLLIGLYEPQEGSVLIDGTDVRQIDPADIRRAVGVTMQDILLFQGTVRDNISMGAPYAEDAMILESARLAGVDEFVSKHPSGYDLAVGERGATLSGGQRQCIALARALLPNPPILMLDEPTSMMDMTSERHFVERLKEGFKDKTLLIVTHRPSLFQAVDRLIVMSRGSINADGPCEEILKGARKKKAALLQ